MDEKPDAQIQLGLDCYDPEHRVFALLPNKVKIGKPLTKREILLILKWKTARIKDDNAETVTALNMEKINQVVTDATCTTSDANKIRALEKLATIPGIRLATATAILTVCYPEEFTIIDRRVLSQLNLVPVRIARKRGSEGKPKYDTNDWTPADYVKAYLPRVKEISRKRGCTLRDADRALWGLSVNDRIEEIILKSQGPS
jgi:hypothetical protein